MEKLTLWRIKLHVIFVSHGFFLRILTLLATFLQMTHKYPARDYREYGSIILSLYFQCAGWDIFWHFPGEGERRWQWPWRLHCQSDGRYSNFPHLTSHSLYDLCNSYNLQLFHLLKLLQLLQLLQLTYNLQLLQLTAIATLPSLITLTALLELWQVLQLRFLTTSSFKLSELDKISEARRWQSWPG